MCKVRKIFVGTKGIPHLVTHDDHTIRYPDPLIKVNDTIQTDLETGKITDFIKFDTGVAQMVKHLSAMQETRVRSLVREDPLEKAMAAHSSILAWKIPWTEQPGGLQPMGSQRVGHD